MADVTPTITPAGFYGTSLDLSGATIGATENGDWVQLGGDLEPTALLLEFTKDGLTDVDFLAQVRYPGDDTTVFSLMNYIGEATGITFTASVNVCVPVNVTTTFDPGDPGASLCLLGLSEIRVRATTTGTADTGDVLKATVIGKNHGRI